jgi:hypothetical protein
MKRNHFETSVAIDSDPTPRAARSSRGRRGPPLDELLAELGYDDIWVPAAEIGPRVSDSAADC